MITQRAAVLRAVLFLLCSATYCLATGGGSKRPFTVEDFMRLRSLTSTAIAPDGSRVLYTIEESDIEHNIRHRSIWVVSAGGGAPSKLVDDASFNTEAAPLWSPDGKQFAFVSDRDGSDQVWAMSAQGGDAVRLTSGPKDVQSFAWSPDGRSLAFIMAEPDAPARQKLKGMRIVSQSDGAGGPQLYLLDLATKVVRQLTKGNLNPDAFSWSPDSKQIAFSAQSDIFVVSVESADVRKLVERPGQDINPLWSPDGRKIAFFTAYGKEKGLRGLSVVSASGGAPQDGLFQNFDVGFGGYPPRFVAWSANSKTLYVSRLSRMTQNLYAVSAATGESKQITPQAQKVYHDFSLTSDTHTMALMSSDPLTPDEIFVSPVDEWKPAQLTAKSNPQLESISISATEVVRWKSKDGLEIEGLLVKPINYEAGKRYPLLVQMEGTYGTYDLSFSSRVSADSPSAQFAFQQQVFAGQGYAVLMPNPRGSWGYGEEFRQRGRESYGVGPYADIIAGVDYMIAQGIADPARLGIMGIAYDGYRAAFTISQTDRFKAASVGMPIGINTVSLYGQAGASFVERIFGGPPWQVPEVYAQNSVINFAGNLKTPTLIFHLQEPPWVAPQAQELYTALQRNKVPVEYVIYEQNFRTFGVKDINLFRDLLQRNVDWFNRWIKQATR